MPFSGLRLIGSLSVVVGIFAGCGDNPEATKPIQPAQETSSKVDMTTPSRNPKIPAEVSYPIVRDEEEFNAFTKKRMVDVKLNMKVSPEALREIALEVKSQEKRQYERTFIFVYIPEQVPDVPPSPWATCHFNPTLQVNIMGLTIENEGNLRRLKLDVPGTRIGAWLIDMQYVGMITVLHEANGRVTMTEFFSNGGQNPREVVELPSDEGRLFRPKKSSDIYAVDRFNVLRIYGAPVLRDTGDGYHLVTGAVPLE